jgi:ribosomal protein S18 acetylase RimI-like enzyme
MHSRGINQWTEVMFTIEGMERAISTHDVFLAYSGDELAGTVRVQLSDPVIWGADDNSNAAYIHRFATDPKFRGQGIGRELLKFAEQHAKASEKTLLRLDCWGKNERLIRYYKDAGFRFLDIVDLEEQMDSGKKATWCVARFEREIE